MMIRKTFRYRVYLSPEQDERARRWEGTLRFVWNLALEQRLLGLSRLKGAKIYRTAFDQINELKALLAQTPPDKTAEAETVAKRTDKLVKELAEDKPDREMVDTMGQSLKRAAENLAGALPLVLPIATQIVAYVLKLAG